MNEELKQVRQLNKLEGLHADLDRSNKTLRNECEDLGAQKEAVYENQCRFGKARADYKQELDEQISAKQQELIGEHELAKEIVAKN